jgi:hypothetical protein
MPFVAIPIGGLVMFVPFGILLIGAASYPPPVWLMLLLHMLFLMTQLRRGWLLHWRHG